LPVNLLEGMASAKAVVATAVGSIPEVTTQENAILVPPSDPDALAQACVRLASDPDLRRRMGQAGLERVTAHYSIDAMVDRTAALYADLLQKHGLEHLVPSQVALQRIP